MQGRSAGPACEHAEAPPASTGDEAPAGGRRAPAHADVVRATVGTWWGSGHGVPAAGYPAVTWGAGWLTPSDRARERAERAGRLRPVTTPTRAELAGLLDVTLLKPEATAAQVADLCAVAAEVGAAAVCVSPARLPLAPDVAAALGRVAVCTVVGFPSGAVRGAVKAAEAARAVQDGAVEVDMVVDLGRVAARDWDGVRADVAAVRAAAPAPVVLKVILESALHDADTLAHLCRLAEEAGADMVKTSTGFHPAGGHTVAAVEVMAGAVGGRLGIKASGGVRSTEQALAVVRAGATRIGASDPAAILADLT